MDQELKPPRTRRRTKEIWVLESFVHLRVLGG
jgi:hypothetical protein